MSNRNYCKFNFTLDIWKGCRTNKFWWVKTTWHTINNRVRTTAAIYINMYIYIDVYTTLFPETDRNVSKSFDILCVWKFVFWKILALNFVKKGIRKKYEWKISIFCIYIRFYCTWSFGKYSVKIQTITWFFYQLSILYRFKQFVDYSAYFLIYLFASNITHIHKNHTHA